MSGIADTTVIDRIELNPDGSVTLVMVESRAWGTDPLQAEQLKQKTNRYIGYAIEGQLVADYPHLAGAPVTIQLDCASEATGEFAHIVEVTTAGLKRLGVTYVANVVQDDVR